ncbi:MAG TPA: YihY/virulence factor BrkB family protein [Streptosporangiaceae bacterium]|nr:YihY/virulence factor BrkB family protein [Streptosporangiaceae bacterium]
MNAAQQLVNRVDQAQQHHPWMAYPVAVWKKFGDDQAGNLAALIAYYAFASIFPLLLVLVTAADIVLRSHPALREHVLKSAFAQFPVLGPQLSQNPHSLHETGPALVIGIVLTFLGARGVAGAAANAMNTVWGVPMFRRPGFPWSLIRQVSLILVVGIGLIVSTTLSGLAGSVSFLHGAAAQAGTIVVSLVLNVGVFWASFRLATAKEISARTMLPSAAVAAVIWQILQLLGTKLVHHLAGSSSVYGVFGIVIGLLAWLYLGAELTLYAVEANVVGARRLWPRSLAPPPLTDVDVRAYAMYAKSQERRPEQHIRSDISESRPGQP